MAPCKSWERSGASGDWYRYWLRWWRLLRPKPNIEKLASGTHGGIDYGELSKLGIAPESVLDFSVSINPFGLPPGLEEALCRVHIHDYPDSGAIELRQALGRKLGIASENIIAGSGSTELIRLIALAYFGPGDKVIIPQPTYSDYEVACQLVDAQVLKQYTSEEMNFQLDVKELIDSIKGHRPKGVFLCNPNNPTGSYLSREEAEEILAVAGDALLVLDEAYIAFTEDAWSSLDLVGSGNLIIVRSMTKDYALAGLRLGYAMSSEPVISALRRVSPPWNVSSLAQKAGIFALEADAYLRECGAKLKDAREFLKNGLIDLSLTPLPSQTNFFMVEVDDAAGFRQALLKEGILVRDCTSFGLPRYVRMAPRTMPECQRLLEAVKKTWVTHHAS
ncbi:MAG: histidinol-phosphate aminotransferase family protein [Chloroflexi bacterium]|nr:histidinol-phosphate aminotransferase family protein [Chloroflexota bacterium]